jgi:hypothetical protein
MIFMSALRLPLRPASYSEIRGIDKEGKAECSGASNWTIPVRRPRGETILRGVFPESPAGSRNEGPIAQI